jgi:2,4-dienoyl-CoA reductase-like NADH-dependent reductase (Old Yellow Enzyme family)
MADLRIAQPFTLKCGLTLPNRLVKAAMAEAMADQQLPGPQFHSTYGEWADGEYGMVITGIYHGPLLCNRPAHLTNVSR